MIRKLTGLLALATVAAPILPAHAADKPFSVVLVHGAFVDASGWRAVHDRLTEDGYEVLVVQNPTITLEDDVAITQKAIAKAKHPVILVGHSYGGSVITEAGNDPKVRSLVYLAAFAPDVGESVAKLAETPVPGEPGAPLLPPADGFLIVDPAKFPAAFAADVDPGTTAFMARAQVPWGLDAVGGVITHAAWKSKPSYFMVTTQDRMVPPTAQRTMAKRADGKTQEIASSHAVMMSRPDEVAAFIESADGSKQ
ncbi:alpha/beta hydrolase [Aureimonas jatrophae]|uniref:Pimeloyl-ACP methyl ester carboxylesterase n=1 Tax=Aureimonas jatrophae TaxID=1166073 RepID=A0A1H0KBT3_9HYPH|nr:alpha/beta hydrolase [Aureimonas jatrophae]MBB3951050.1 pimeloyl-ACP methyl ester carboxylesterase [Aureimonas jatrophae]SDO53374.1 Pimeloyl-ACP methyl ester carboxylesterase [Aureimonas jatrophae]